MIIKRIRQCAQRKQRSFKRLAALVVALTTYAVDANPDRLTALIQQSRAASYVLDAGDLTEFGLEPGEKVALHGSLNLVGANVIEHQQQMLAACLLAPSAADPIEHYVVSWRDGELPSDSQIEEVVDVFAEEMGYANCQIVWATHSNTAHYHLHLVVNRVDLCEGRVVSPGGGWEIDRLHQIVALIENQQGWSSEQGAIYRAEGGVVFDRATEQVVRRADGSREGCYKRKSEAPEVGRGAGFKGIVAALREAGSWRDLHYLLAAHDAAYLTKGSGAEVRVGTDRTPASDFGREFSFSKMVARLGPYEEDVTKSRDPHELYRVALREERARLREALNAALEHLRKKRRLARKRAAQWKRDAHAQTIDDARLELAFDLIEAEVRKMFDKARQTIAASYLNRERWYKAGQPPATPVQLPELIWAGDYSRDRHLAQQRGLHAEANAAGVDYLDEAGELALSDYGVLILVRVADTRAVEVALTLASTRSERITVSGSEEFLAACRSIAGTRGYNLVLEDGTPLHPMPSAATFPKGGSDQLCSASVDGATKHETLARDGRLGRASASVDDQAILAENLQSSEVSQRGSPSLPAISADTVDREFDLWTHWQTRDRGRA